ncbi:hypothetical protein NM688_g2740 [Phlebia brevispora]|uniref:Uncharacterized protein n=1 Tax=Phlebia brevispora TaxID=194682 RepID=A0ACC1T7T1_9APHY|nr:hypothetical protein NM688_g2740 [Phlebia brevispora]
MGELPQAVPEGPLRSFVSLGMFIIDQFSYLDENGHPTAKSSSEQIGGGGTYATIGARIWLPPHEVGMIVDRGHDFPSNIQSRLDSYGEGMWLYRDDASRGTTRALNEYRGDLRGFKYLTPRVRITPRDLIDTTLDRPNMLHFICSPSRASAIMSEVHERESWTPTSIYEPIPDRCVPEELPALIKVLPFISILSPNADEAHALLSMPQPPTKASVEEACQRFLNLGVGPNGEGAVVIRSGAMGAYVATRAKGGQWVPAYWGAHEAHRVVDVTGAGNAFLGGLAAGLHFTRGDVYKATLYATVSSSFIIEQEGLPILSRREEANGTIVELWNGETPQSRLELLMDTKVI